MGLLITRICHWVEGECLYVFRATSSAFTVTEIEAQRIGGEEAHRGTGFPLSMGLKPISLYSGKFFMLYSSSPERGQGNGASFWKIISYFRFCLGRITCWYIPKCNLPRFITYVSVIIWIRSCFSSSVHSHTSSKICTGQKSGHAACFLSVL